MKNSAPNRFDRVSLHFQKSSTFWEVGLHPPQTPPASRKCNGWRWPAIFDFKNLPPPPPHFENRFAACGPTHDPFVFLITCSFPACQRVPLSSNLCHDRSWHRLTWHPELPRVHVPLIVIDISRLNLLGAPRGAHGSKWLKAAAI